MAADIAGDVFAYASVQKIPTLQAIADYSQGDFENLRRSRLTDAALYQTTQDAAYITDLPSRL